MKLKRLRRKSKLYAAAMWVFLLMAVGWAVMMVVLIGRSHHPHRFRPGPGILSPWVALVLFAYFSYFAKDAAEQQERQAWYRARFLKYTGGERVPGKRHYEAQERCRKKFLKYDAWLETEIVRVDRERYDVTHQPNMSTAEYAEAELLDDALLEEKQEFERERRILRHVAEHYDLQV